MKRNDVIMDFMSGDQTWKRRERLTIQSAYEKEIHC